MPTHKAHQSAGKKPSTPKSSGTAKSGTAVVGFYVGCGSRTSPGIDTPGVYEMEISLHYKGRAKPVYIHVPVKGADPRKHGSGSQGAGSGSGTSGSGGRARGQAGDDTPQIAQSAQAAISGSSELTSEEKSHIQVETDQGGPGNTLGRILIRDPNLIGIDAAENAGGKIQLFVFWAVPVSGSGRYDPWPPRFRPISPIPPKRVPHQLPHPWKTRRTHLYKKSVPIPKKSAGAAMKGNVGDTRHQLVDPNRPWARVEGQVILGMSGVSYGLVPTSFLSSDAIGFRICCIPIVCVPSSARAQARAARLALRQYGVGADVRGASLRIPASDQHGVSIDAVGFYLPGGADDLVTDFPWSVFVGSLQHESPGGFEMRFDPLRSSAGSAPGPWHRAARMLSFQMNATQPNDEGTTSPEAHRAAGHASEGSQPRRGGPLDGGGGGEAALRTT